MSLGLLTRALSGRRRVIGIADQGVVWAAPVPSVTPESRTSMRHPRALPTLAANPNGTALPLVRSATPESRTPMRHPRACWSPIPMARRYHRYPARHLKAAHQCAHPTGRRRWSPIPMARRYHRYPARHLKARAAIFGPRTRRSPQS